MAELFQCCSATTTSETFWQMVQSFKELSSPYMPYLHQSGISPERSLVSIIILFASSFTALVYVFWTYSLLPSRVTQSVQLSSPLEKKWFNETKVKLTLWRLTVSPTTRVTLLNGILKYEVLPLQGLWGNWTGNLLIPPLDSFVFIIKSVPYSKTGNWSNVFCFIFHLVTIGLSNLILTENRG